MLNSSPTKNFTAGNRETEKVQKVAEFDPNILFNVLPLLPSHLLPLLTIRTPSGQIQQELSGLRNDLSAFSLGNPDVAWIHHPSKAQCGFSSFRNR